MTEFYRRNISGARAENGPPPVRTGRIMTGRSQEEMAGILHIDPRTLRRYESGEEATPDDVMLKVAELAKSPMLMYLHFKVKYQIADEILPQVEEMPLAQAVVNLLSELAELEQSGVASKLLALAADGLIDPGEEKDFDFIMARLDGVRRGVELLRYSRKE